MNDFIPKTVLVVAAHADDNEFCFGGSIAKWIQAGADVHYLIVTDGQRGTSNTEIDSDELKSVRASEQRAAADVLGVKSVEYLNYEDGRMELTWELRRDIVSAIRKIKPDTVLCMDPTFLYSSAQNYVNHNDHRVVGQATFDAVYPLARDESAFSELAELEPHKVKDLLMYNLEKEDCFIDISDCMGKKIAAMAAHSSQADDGQKMEQTLRDYASVCAKKTSDCSYAEGFVRLTLD